ncbi:kelch domain-containing protein 10 [Anabrus simplex]|uniref:kelch domain-containing protein 10 n=1 Tax=Anabrus simplex TaxID=316456 RepID=UPI0035A2C5E3
MAGDESSEDYKFKPFSFTTRLGEIANTRPITPQPRSGHRIVCDEGFLYSFGGYNPFLDPSDPSMHGDAVWALTCPLFKELWRYSYASNTWFRLLVGEGIPNELASNAVVLSGDLMLVFGGTAVPFGESCSNSLYVYNTKCGGGMHTIETTGDHPQKQYGQALILHKKFLYTVGGTTGYDYSSDIHRLNLETNKWEEIYTSSPVGSHYEPPGRYRHELAFDGKKIYVFGGGTATTVYGFDIISAFNLETKKWEELATHSDPTVTPPGFPAARRCHGCVQLPAEVEEKNEIVICGGYNGGEIFSDVWKFDLSTLQWTCLKQCVLPRPVYFHSAAISPAGQLFTFGGIAALGSETVRTAEIYCAWLRIPKLSEMCWETITRKYPNLYAVPRNKLLKLGIPEKFVSRLL